MIQATSINDKNIAYLTGKAKTELTRRNKLYQEYLKKDSPESFSSDSDTDIKVPLEFYIGNQATGYMGGKAPKYTVNNITDSKKINIIKKIYNKIVGAKDVKEQMEIIIDHIVNYNDDPTEYLELVKDYLLKSACYEIIYENNDNEIVYANFDALQTVGVWDYNTPKNLVGLLRIWTEENDGKTIEIIESITREGRTQYTKEDKEYKMYTELNPNQTWSDVPAIAIENPDGMAIFEPSMSLISAIQNSIKNMRNTHQYNDEAKLKIMGYEAENSITIVNEEGQVVANPARIIEDEAILRAKTLFLQEGGNAEWIEKNINDSAFQNYIKTLIDLIFMIPGIPNTTDLGFSKADNASAIDRKFFALEQTIALAVKLFAKGLTRRWELIFNHINEKNDKDYPFREVKTTLYRNLPTDKYTDTERAISLRGLLSDETCISFLPDELDPTNEIQKRDAEEKEEFNNLAKKVGDNENEKDITTTLEGNRQDTITSTKQVQDSRKANTIKNK